MTDDILTFICGYLLVTGLVTIIIYFVLKIMYGRDDDSGGGFLPGA